MKILNIGTFKKQIPIKDMRCDDFTSDKFFDEAYASLLNTADGFLFMKKVLDEKINEDTEMVEVCLCDDLFTLKACVKETHYNVVQIAEHNYLYGIGEGLLDNTTLCLAILAFDLTVKV